MMIGEASQTAHSQLGQMKSYNAGPVAATALEGIVNQLVDIRKDSDMILSRIERFLERTQGPVPQSVGDAMKEPAPAGLLSQVGSLLNSIANLHDRTLKALNEVDRIG